MIKKLSLAGLLVVGALLAGCAGQPNVYYTLTATPDSAMTAAAATPTVGLYTLVSVSVPAPVDDTLLIVRQSDDRLMKLAHDRWTAPLGKQFNNALAVALTHELGMPPLSRTQAAVDGQVMNISVDVQRFDLVPGQYAELAAVWQLAPASASGKSTKYAKMVCYTQVRQAVDPGVAPLVKAQQANILKLATAISAGWQSGQPGTDTRCQ